MTPTKNIMNNVDTRYLPPSTDYLKPCLPEICCDVVEGVFPFDGPATVYLQGNTGCHKKSYLVVKLDVVDGETVETPWSSVWTHSPSAIQCEGKFLVKYKWNKCDDIEPVFSQASCCECDK